MNNQALDDSSSSSNDQPLRLERLVPNAASWMHPQCVPGLFAVHRDGQAYDSTTMTLEQLTEEPGPAGVRHRVARFRSPEIAVDYHILSYEGTSLLEVWPIVRNSSTKTLRVTRLDSIRLALPAGEAEPPEEAEILSYTSDWGAEFEPLHAPLSDALTLQSRSGRSTKGNHPWFAVTRPDGAVFSASVAWSGNWIFRFDPLPEGGSLLSGGLSDWEFYIDLSPDEEMSGPHVILVWGADLNAVSQQYAAVGRKHWYPRTRLSAKAPVEWNHWWPYEDAEINEEVFAQNVEESARLGMEVCTLDAGWFGPSNPGSHWYDYRGDWDLVNEKRFPRGVRPLSDLTHARGMAFGIWCEIEGLGVKAQLAQDHPDFPALRGGERLGYVCFGNPDVQEWAFQTLSRLITEYNADWVKLDFNLDPGAGCDRTDHGHCAGDGLYAHYMGYYRMLDRVRKAFPEVVLENCSSGGLRIDLEILRHTDMTYLSDPDWPEHNLQLFWGASTMLAPDSMLHWGYGHWRGSNPHQKFNPHDPRLTPRQFDYYTRTSMLNLFGFSQKLPELPGWMAERIAAHTRIYKEHVRRFVREGTLARLTGQPRRSGEGDRLAAFQYSLPDGSEHLLFVFRMPGETGAGRVILTGLEPERTYRITGFEGEDLGEARGSDLMTQGLDFSSLEEESSALLRIS